MTTILLQSEAEQLAFGGTLAQVLRDMAGSVHLRGELGTGKTTLVRGVLRGLGHQGPVRSPTYTLLEPYTPDGLQVYHLDLYRLGDAEELEYLGLRDLIGGEGLILVEWPERGRGWLPPPDLDIEIRHAGPGRRLVLTPSKRWRECLRSLDPASG